MRLSQHRLHPPCNLGQAAHAESCRLVDAVQRLVELEDEV